MQERVNMCIHKKSDFIKINNEPAAVVTRNDDTGDGIAIEEYGQTELFLVEKKKGIETSSMQKQMWWSCLSLSF